MLSASIAYALIVLCSVIALPILILRKRVRGHGLAVFTPFAVTAMIIAASISSPWFATFAPWRWLRLVFLFLWLPAMLVLEHKQWLSYSDSYAKWGFRVSVFSILLAFGGWALDKTENWELVSTAQTNDSQAWLAGRNGEDGYLFVKAGDGSLASDKLLDSVGGDIRNYSIRTHNARIELCLQARGASAIECHATR